MELNLVPLLEAARALTWQGALVILAIIAGTCFMSWMRLVHGDRERAFWREATPEQIMARAATAATLPPPTKAPVSPAGPLATLAILVLAGMLMQSHYISASLSRKCTNCMDYVPDNRAEGFPIYTEVGSNVQVQR